MKLSVFWMSAAACVMSAAALVVSIVALTCNNGDRATVRQIGELIDQHAKIINAHKIENEKCLNAMADKLIEMTEDDKAQRRGIEAVAHVVDTKFAAVQARLK